MRPGRRVSTSGAAAGLPGRRPLGQSLTRGLGLLGAFASLLCAQSASAKASEPTVAELLASIGLDAEAGARVLEGAIVVVDLERSEANELAVGAALLIDASPEQVMRSLESGRFRDGDPDLLLQGSIDLDRGVLDGIPTALQSEAASSELEDLLRLRPGARFNFSVAEAEQLLAASREARLGRTQKHPAVASATAEAWQSVLRDRARSYLQRGLDGVAPYDRGENRISEPAAELASAHSAELLLRERLPLLSAALDGAPEPSSAGVQHRFRWLQKRVEGRMQFVLLHQAASRESHLLGFVERQFFVGHTYNSLQTLTVCLPVGERTLIVHTNRTFTDAILGMAEQIALRVGQHRLRAEVVADAERLHLVVAQAPTEQLASRSAGPATSGSASSVVARPLEVVD